MKKPKQILSLKDACETIIDGLYDADIDNTQVFVNESYSRKYGRRLSCSIYTVYGQGKYIFNSEKTMGEFAIETIGLIVNTLRPFIEREIEENRRKFEEQRRYMAEYNASKKEDEATGKTKRFVEKKFVYLIADVNKEFGKIGISNDVEKRRKGLSSGNPRKTFVVCSFLAPSPRKMETILHEKFGYSRKNGEWFAYEDKIEQEFIALSQDNPNSTFNPNP
tara:strand:- start:41 stop:703 length:663 start_codon:yes stop_codon:yes gene_type:complete